MKMQENVLRRVRMVEDKHGIKYAKTDGRLYKVLRILYTLLFIYTMGINLLYIAGMFLVYGGTDNFVSIQNTLITVCACTAAVILGYVLSFFKFKFCAGIISVAAEVFLILSFASAMEDSLGLWGYKISFYWRHLAPLALMIIFMIWLTVIAVSARLKTEKQYKKVVDNLYNIYNQPDVDVSDEQWNEFLANYDPNDYTKLYKNNDAKNEEETETIEE